MRDIVLAACGVSIAALLALTIYQNNRRFHRPLLTTAYQAVTTSSGEVFYGRIDHLGSDHPVLRDAFSIRTETDAQTQRSRQVLVWRKDGATGADHLIFPAASIAFVEPVQAESAIGRLIREARPAR